VITLVLGGARSGKSIFAEGLARRSTTPVTYVATLSAGNDDDLAARIDAHRRRRPPEWETLECRDDLAATLSRTRGTVLVDSMGPWLANQPDMTVDVEGLCLALTSRSGDTIVVSDEVGFGVHPETAIGRNFRDALGTLNQEVAAVADVVYLVVAGRALLLPGEPST
jgi:adenosyl cobinamide kinase/adenosyl cobinamide phosphate guanylyltransferase